MIVKWTRVTDVAPYIEAGDWPEEKCSLTYRLYSAEGKKYPLLQIAIYGNSGAVRLNEKVTGISISSAYKKKAKEWWSTYPDDCLIPFELLPDLNEMLLEVKEKYIDKVADEI